VSIWVSGVGGVGGWIAHQMASAGEDVSLVVRPGAAARWQGTGLTLITEDGRRPALHLAVREQLGELSAPTLVVVTVKTPELTAALQRLAPHLPEGVPVLLLQNGLGAAEAAQAALPGRAVIHAPVFVVGWTSAPGEVTAYLPRRIVLPREGVFEALFRGAGFNVETVDDLPGALWRKAVFLIAFAALDVETGGGAGVVAALPRHRALVEELCCLAAAEGHPLPGGTVEEVVSFTRSMRPDAHSSLWRDVQGGRGGEWEDLVGWCQRRARGRSLDLPVLLSLTSPVSVAG
jgi:2-dehydropantoate 2-reductase